MKLPFRGLFGGDKGRHAVPDHHLLIERAMEDLRVKTGFCDATWGLGKAGWEADLEAGTMVFTKPQGLRATVGIQVVGTYNTRDGTWLWGWEHPSVPEPLQAHASTVRQYGIEHGIADNQDSRPRSGLQQLPHA